MATIIHAPIRPRPEPELQQTSPCDMDTPPEPESSLNRTEASLILLRHEMVQQRTDSLGQAVVTTF